MFEVVIAGFIDSLQISNLMFVFVGVVAGMMAGAIPGADYALLAGVGHLMNVERTDLFNAAVNDFLSQHNLS